jgi:hypothetical protein
MENGQKAVTNERIQGFDNNLKGTVAEFEKAKTAEPATEVCANIKFQAINGETISIEID